MGKPAPAALLTAGGCPEDACRQSDNKQITQASVKPTAKNGGAGYRSAPLIPGQAGFSPTAHVPACQPLCRSCPLPAQTLKCWSCACSVLQGYYFKVIARNANLGSAGSVGSVSRCVCTLSHRQGDVHLGTPCWMTPVWCIGLHSGSYPW